MARILVTGASSGVGLNTVEALADEGHEVFLHARNPRRTKDLPVRSRVAGVLHADLAREEEVRRMATEMTELGPLDAVIHNAGTYEGPELATVNVVAPYLLTALAPLPSRWICLSSSMHRCGSVQPLLMDGISYSTSKLLVTTLAMALAWRYPQMSCQAVDPGWVPTRMGGLDAPDSLEEAHRTQIWLATAPLTQVNPSTGGYWHHFVASTPAAACLDEAAQDQLLELLSSTYSPLP